MKSIEKVLSAFEKTMLIAGIMSGAVVLFINVLLRNVGLSIVWAEEFAKFSIIWITFGGCGAAVREKSHMNISALYDIMNKSMKKALDVFINLAGMAFSAFMLYYGIRLVEKTIATMQVSPTMQLPMWIVYISVPLGAVLMALRYGTNLVRIFSKTADSGETEI